jgi:PII-like signaling protein
MSKGQPPERMRVDREAVHLTLFVAEPHVGDRRSKVDQLMREAATSGASGGTVLAAYEGFGRRHSHERTIWHAADKTPLRVIFVDTAERIAVLMGLVERILPDSVMVTKNVRAIQYVRPHTHQPTGPLSTEG